MTTGTDRNGYTVLVFAGVFALLSGAVAHYSGVGFTGSDDSLVSLVATIAGMIIGGFAGVYVAIQAVFQNHVEGDVGPEVSRNE